MLTQNIARIEIYSCNKTTTVWLTVIKMCVNIVLDYIIIEREKICNSKASDRTKCTPLHSAARQGKNFNALSRNDSKVHIGINVLKSF